MTVEVFDDIISQKEIRYLLKFMKKRDRYFPPTEQRKLWLKHGFDWGAADWPKLWIINTLKKVNVRSFPESIYFSILSSPLDIHTDTGKAEKCHKHVIIPLEVKDSASTVIFDNKWYGSDFQVNYDNKHLLENFKKDEPFDKLLYEKYLKHFDYKLLEGLSVKCVYEWKVGSICVFDSQYIHTNGYLTSPKKAINIWTVNTL